MLHMVITWHGHSLLVPIMVIAHSFNTNWHVHNQDTHVQTTKMIQSFAKMVGNLVLFLFFVIFKFPFEDCAIGNTTMKFFKQKEVWDVRIALLWETKPTDTSLVIASLTVP
jgi:hypothetical protein